MEKNNNELIAKEIIQEVNNWPENPYNTNSYDEIEGFILDELETKNLLNKDADHIFVKEIIFNILYDIGKNLERV